MCAEISNSDWRSDSGNEGNVKKGDDSGTLKGVDIDVLDACSDFRGLSMWPKSPDARIREVREASFLCVASDYRGINCHRSVNADSDKMIPEVLTCDLSLRSSSGPSSAHISSREANGSA